MATVWHDGEQWRSWCHERFYRDTAAHRLTYLGSDEPGASMLRVLKFVRKGYSISPEQLSRVIADQLDTFPEGLSLEERVSALRDRLRAIDPLTQELAQIQLEDMMEG